MKTYVCAHELGLCPHFRWNIIDYSQLKRILYALSRDVWRDHEAERTSNDFRIFLNSVRCDYRESEFLCIQAVDQRWDVVWRWERT